MIVGAAAALPQAVASTVGRLHEVAPVEAARAGAVLEEVLRPVSATRWPEVAHRFSRLTNTGVPVEFAWA